MIVGDFVRKNWRLCEPEEPEMVFSSVTGIKIDVKIIFYQRAVWLSAQSVYRNVDVVVYFL